MSRRRRAVKVKRHYRAGTPVDTEPGSSLEVAVLARLGYEIFGVDLASGGFVRVEVITGGLAEGDAGTGAMSPDPDSPHDAGGPHDEVASRLRRGTVIRVEVADDEPVDPGRPEALWVEGEPAPTAVLKRRRVRRLLRAVAAPEVRRGLVLGTRVPSVAYADLDPARPSMMVIGLTPRRCRLSTTRAGEARLTFSWGGLRQTLAIADPDAMGIGSRPAEALRGDALSRFLGFKPRYALIANLPVANGYVTKAVLALFDG